MYHAIVRRRVRDLFRAVNHGNAEPVLHSHASSSIPFWATMPRADRERFRLPDNGTSGFIDSCPTFGLISGTVSGGPWKTIVVIEWDETNSGTDGVHTYNHGVHVMHLRWGRATRLLICPDTVGLRPIAIIRRSCSDSLLTASQMDQVFGSDSQSLADFQMERGLRRRARL